MSTLMWEAVAMPGHAQGLVEWAFTAAPAADVYRSRDDRVVVIADGVDALPDPPAGLLAREPHAWTFERVPRS